jgi:hypothetical protein
VSLSIPANQKASGMSATEPPVRPLDEKADWEFFHPRHPIVPADRNRIRPLEETAARLLWQELVSADPRCRHPMLLPRDHWTGRFVASGPNWQPGWEQPSGNNAVVEFLRAQIAWPDEADVCFIEMRERAVQAPWGVFLRAWRNFLFNDEGPFVIRPGHAEFVSFGPRGFLAVGYRA